jgi:hypothetical protein
MCGSARTGRNVHLKWLVLIRPLLAGFDRPLTAMTSGVHKKEKATQ